MNLCVIIPVYNHEQALPQLLDNLKRQGLPCILVNDGSSPACGKVLADCVQHAPDWLTLIERPDNGGKGAAVIDGFQYALAHGYSHAIQIDADGQHRVDDMVTFIEQARQHPQAMILGKPIYHGDAPWSRVYGRRFTNLWIWINTLSFAIADGMCGFRLYPLAEVETLLQRGELAAGMAFDIDIAVRLYWQGVEAINLPTVVSYPLDGVSHFKLLRDNGLISLVHARLFFGMLIRIPRLLSRHWR